MKKWCVPGHFFPITVLGDGGWIYSPPQKDTEDSVFHCFSESVCARNQFSWTPKDQGSETAWKN